MSFLSKVMIPKAAIKLCELKLTTKKSIFGKVAINIVEVSVSIKIRSVLNDVR